MAQEYTVYNPSENCALLKLSFYQNRAMSTLHLSPRLEQFLGNSSTTHIPTYGKDTSMTSYINNINKLIVSRLEEVEKYYKFRNEYITAILAHQRQSLIEYDKLTFSNIHLLLEVDDFYCIVSIELGK